MAAMLAECVMIETQNIVRCYISYPSGGVPEWTIGTVLKTVEPNKLREFESHPLRLNKKKGAFNEIGNDLFLF